MDLLYLTQPTQKQRWSGTYFAAAGASLAFSIVVCAPLENAKTLMQRFPNVYTSFGATVSNIIEHRGVAGLFTGVEARLLSVLPIRLSRAVIPPLMTAIVKPVFGSNFVADAFRGALVAIPTSLILCPAEHISRRQVAATVTEQDVTFMGVARREVELGGVLALYKSLIPCIMRDALSSVVRFCSYNFIFDILAANKTIAGGVDRAGDEALSLRTRIGLSAASALLAAVVSAPFDAVMTRMSTSGDKDMNQAFDSIVADGGSAFSGVESRAIRAVIARPLVSYSFPFFQMLTSAITGVGSQ